MSNAISLFPLLRPDQILEAGFDTGMPVLYYHDDDGPSDMELRDKEGLDDLFSAVIYDPACKWTPQTHELHLKQTISIQKPAVWFGPHGIAPKNAVLGIALHWSSVGSEQQGVFQMGSLSSQTSTVELDGTIKFPRGFLKGSIIIDVELFLKSPGRARPDEKHLCNTSGTILGKLARYQIYIDGNGSTFPIVTESNSDKPLWYVSVDVDDILTDMFEFEKVSIILNTAHKDYHLIDHESPDYSMPFFAEVLSDALTMMTFLLKETAEDQGAWENILSGDNYDEGSVASAMNYFIMKLGWNTDSLPSMSESIHRYIDKNLKGEMQ